MAARMDFSSLPAGGLSLPRYSSSLTWSPHVALVPWSSTSHMAMWVMKWSGAAPCQCHSPGGA